jgi:hypothetical protein
MSRSDDDLQYGLLAASLALASIGRVSRSMARPAQPKPAQTNAVDPEALPEPPESRQVRRHRLRMEAKRNRRAA